MEQEPSWFGEFDDLPDEVRLFYVKVFGEELARASCLILKGSRRIEVEDIEQYDEEKIVRAGGELLSRGILESQSEKVLVGKTSGEDPEHFFVIEHKAQ